MPHRSRHGFMALAGCLVAVLLSGCASESGSYLGSAQWTPQPEQQAPSIPGPKQPSNPGSPTEQQPGNADPVRATNLDQPTTIAPLPDGTALVGERTSGRVTRVYAQPDRPAQELYVIPGVDGSTGSGLMALAVSPRYSENGLIYAYIATATDGRIISLNKAGVPKDVLLGLPKGPAAMTFAPDGSLLVATGGSNHQYADKILTINDWGEPGPMAIDGIVMAPGVSNPVGMCSDGKRVYVVQGGTNTSGTLTGNGVFEVGGADGGGMSSAMDPLISYQGEAAGAAGCVATGVVIVTAGLDSQSLATSALNQNGTVAGDPTLALTGEYGRLRAIALDPMTGGLWVGTYNRDGIGTPAADDDKVILISSPTGGGADNPS